ncbi:YDG domain-containing protein, partial [Desulfothermus okinawensis]
PLTATYTASDKVYDRTTKADVTATSNDIISGDDVNLTATGEFEDKNVGTDKSVNVSGTLSGADAGNYAFQNPTSTVKADITPKP